MNVSRISLLRRLALLTLVVGASLCGIASPRPASAQAENLRFDFTLQDKGGLQTIGYNHTWQTPMTTTRPAHIKKEPTYKNAPLYVSLPFGDKPGYSVTFVLDEDESDAKFYADANGNGDLTDDPVPTVQKDPVLEERRKPKGPSVIWLYYRFTTTVQAAYANGETAPLNLYFYIYSKGDCERNKIAPVLLYYRDYVRTGSLTLKGKAYRAMLVDDNSDGRYNSDPVPNFRFMGDLLMVDTDASGKFERPYEAFPVNQPFNIGGTTYEIAGLNAGGSSVTFKRSDKTVAERKAPPTLKVGDAPPEIAVTGLNGKPFSLSAYKGKVVLVDFWATWCGPCIEEMPNVRRVYEKYKGQGFDIVGISLDQPNDGPKAAKYAKENAMPWAQVHDATHDITKRYYVTAIPQTFLIGRDGRIIATGLRGPALEKAIAEAVK